MPNQKDVTLLRDLTKQYVEICNKPRQAELRDLWRKHNSLVRTRPLIYVRWQAAWREHPWAEPECEEPFFRQHETHLRQMIYQDRIGDDYILEPWLIQHAAVVTPPEGLWGVKIGRIPSTEPRGSWMFDPPLKNLDDIDKLVVPRHRIDEEATTRNVERLRDAVGDLIEIGVDRAPAWQVWNADISTQLAYLRGLEQAMWDMADNPEWLHRLVGFMRDGVQKAQREAEEAGDWHLCNHQNQAMPYAEELRDPAANGASVQRSDLWCFCAAQEMAQVSPDMHNEFILQYQLPILKEFGLVAYGCCEDLTHKIDMLRQIPNLRRIAVTPWADVEQCADQIREDYVFSWRPSPAEMICNGFDPGRVRRVVSDAMEKCEGCHVDITLKDVQTVNQKPDDLIEWVRIVRDITDKY